MKKGLFSPFLAVKNRKAQPLDPVQGAKTMPRKESFLLTYKTQKQRGLCHKAQATKSG